jgi:Sec-independent protein secretion pathway component TatC
MFYLKELLFRIQYVFISFSITLFVCYGNKDLLFFLLTFNFLASNSNDCASQPGIEYLIYTHPSELLSTYIGIVFYFAVIISSYHFFWNVIDFTKSSLRHSAFVSMNNGIIKTAVIFFLLNIFFLLFLFPGCWNFFESFNQTSDGTTLRFFFELKVKDYVSFFKSLLYTTNVGLALIFLLCFFLNKQRFRKLLSWKKLYLFSNFVFATIFASGDVSSQILNIATLNFFVELTILFRIINLKSKKQIKYFVIQ